MIVACMLVLAALVVAGVVLVPRLLGPADPSVEEAASTTSLTGGAAASSGGYDYFYSGSRNAILRAKPDGSSPETVLSIPVNSQNGYDMPSFYVMGIAVTDDLVFYSALHSESTSVHSYYEVRCVKTDGSNDHSVFRAESEDDISRSISGLYAYDGRAYFGVFSNRLDVDISTMQVMSSDAEGNDQQTLGTLDDWSGGAPLITPDAIYYTEYVFTDQNNSHSSVYTCNIDGSGAKRLFDAENVYLSSLAVEGDKLYCSSFSSGTTDGRIMSIDVNTGETQTLYRADEGENVNLLAIDGGEAYVERYSTAEMDLTEWDLVRVPLDGGGAEVMRTGLEYYNPSLAVMNGHLLVLENGQDIASLGMKATALDPKDGSVIATYVS